MGNNEISIKAVNQFIQDVITLTQHSKIKWEIVKSDLKYDYSKLFQPSSHCTRYSGEFNNNTFTLVTKKNKFNFEIKFQDTPDVINILPFITDNTVQQNLEQLFLVITNPSETYEKYKNLFVTASTNTLA